MSVEIMQSGGIAMRFFRFGNENGQPFIIIPGVALKSVMESEELIRVQYSALAEECCIYVFDRREDAPEDLSIYDMADDTVIALDMLGIKKAVLYGVSQGGMIALTAAIKRPDLISRLIVCSTAPYIPKAAADVFESWAALAESRRREELVMSFAENVYTEGYRRQYHDAFISFADSVTDGELARFVIMSNSFKGFDIRSELSSIAVPVLTIGAKNDKLFGTEGAELIAAQTNGKKILYPNDAHGVYDENADVLVQIAEHLK